ncbi:MAG: hypothetical protein CL873_04410 [Dehalococcoidales bacterium]|mgnify:FL=1|jgi:hypothetical protein|nr:hypothetical protein [Dehalococcoidales bacterium]
MPDRAQHTKGKHTSHNKKGKARRSHPNKSSQQVSVSLTTKATAPPEKVATSLTDVVTQPPTAVRCPNLLIELRRVAILAVVILTILLALILVLD